MISVFQAQFWVSEPHAWSRIVARLLLVKGEGLLASPLLEPPMKKIAFRKRVLLRLEPPALGASSLYSVQERFVDCTLRVAQMHFRAHLQHTLASTRNLCQPHSR